MAYLPILVVLFFALTVAVALLALGFLVSPHKPNRGKLAPYECGFPALEDARIPFDVRFYLVAVVFILFDVETTLLFPWAVSFSSLSAASQAAVFFFLGLLAWGFLYEWAKGALEWE